MDITVFVPEVVDVYRTADRTMLRVREAGPWLEGGRGVLVILSFANDAKLEHFLSAATKAAGVVVGVDK